LIAESVTFHPSVDLGVVAVADQFRCGEPVGDLVGEVVGKPGGGQPGGATAQGRNSHSDAFASTFAENVHFPEAGPRSEWSGKADHIEAETV